MPNTHETLTSLFTDIADAIREKTGGTDTIVADDFPDEISAIPTGTPRTSSDVTVSGATVSVPAGLYGSAVSKSVASGSAGTPTATKGSVSNHSVTVTPQVTNSTGYITGGTKTGNGVTVSASELVSGKWQLSDTNVANVANYQYAQVVDSNLVAENIKKDVTILGITGTHEGGTTPTLIEKSITQNGTYNASDDNADGYSKVTVAVSGGGGATVVEEENEFGGITMTITE